MSNQNYALMSLQELKSLLHSRGIKSTGKKKELVERLLSLDHMSIESQPSEPEYHMTLPDITGYKDITTDCTIPPIALSSIERYFKSNDKEFEQKYIDLYNEKFIRFVRMKISESGIFFHGVVWAEMRKSVTYKVDVLMDEDGMFAEAQCECGAGQGPNAHCKHVGAVLYSLHCVTVGGKVCFEETCTQKLQAFHKAKAYRGSPKKMAALRKHTLNYDPRPPKFRNATTYRDYFRNTVLQYRGLGANMPVFQLYPPANMYGVVNDHCYVGSAEDHLVNSLQLENATPDFISMVESSTSSQADSEDWHMYRTTRITSSHFGDVVKSTERRDINKLLSSLLDPQSFSTKATMYGVKYEAIAKAKYSKLLDIDVVDSGLQISSSHPYLAASPDGLVGEDTVVEIKCPFKAKDCEITANTVPYLSDGGLKKNHSYYYQVQGQLFCTNRKKAHFCVYTHKDFKMFVVERDEVFINEMVKSLALFYEKHFKPALLEKHLYKNYSKYYF